ncbi:monocarboxylate transporter 13-like, partial [Ruditapes philippinarum]|uniref:monocarboxylate transporter 13-like n=1 Tax=Ruditapes philippinarum TaxID=129788 RepID=UPI00295BEC58
MNAVDKNWSWIVLFGAFLANLLAGGIIFSFGILYTDFIDRLETDALPTAVIGGLAFACSCFVAPFSRTMTLKLGYRFVTVLGAVIAFLGLLLCCFAPSIHYYYVFFGVLC